MDFLCSFVIFVRFTKVAVKNYTCVSSGHLTAQSDTKSVMNGKIFPSASAHYKEVSLTSKGENIFKRKDGRWESRYIKSYDPSGKIKYVFCYGKTYKEAKDKAAKCKTAVATGTPLPQRGSRQSFSVYCDEWLHSRRQYVKDSTYVKYDTILNRHIKPKLGNIYPFAFTTGLIESFSRELLCLEGFSPKTVKDILEVVYPKDVRKEMRVLSREEQSRFIKYLPEDMDSCKFGVLLALLTEPSM